MNNKNLNAQMFEVSIPAPAANMQLPDPGLLNFYKDAQRRVFWILDEINSGLYDIVQYILNCNVEDKGLRAEKRLPIKLIVASPGGSMEIEKTLVSIIEASKTPVYTVAIGMCASAASMIYLAGHKRFATRNSSFLFHQGGCENLEGSYQQIVAFMEKYQKDIEEMSKFYKEHTRFDPKMIDRKLNEGDWYISVDEALKNGIVNEIITDLDILT